jgi:hypothetical protein
MKKVIALLSLLSLAAAMPVVAQTQHNTIARVVTIKAKLGTTMQFEEGLNKFHQWEHEHDYAVPFYTWVIISGERTNQYVVGSFGHDWKDFDEMEKNDAGTRAQILADMGPYTESVAISYWAIHPDISAPAPKPGSQPAPFSSVTTFFFKPGGQNVAMDAIKQADEAIKKSHWSGGVSHWYSLVNGGDGAQMVLATDHENWVSFQPPELSFGKMLAEAYGKDGAEALSKKFNKSLRTVRSEIFRYRPDLSYIPASQ